MILVTLLCNTPYTKNSLSIMGKFGKKILISNRSSLKSFGDS